MDNDWGTAIVVDPRELHRLQADVQKLRTARRWLSRSLVLTVGVCAVGAAVGVTTFYGYTERLATVTREAHDYRSRASRSSEALSALSRSHEHILAATEHAPSVGTSSWGRR